MQLTKRRENKAKLELANRNDKTEAAQKEIVEWEAKVQRCQREFEIISQEIKKEMDRFEVKRVQEFKAIIVKYLEDQMAHQQQVLVFYPIDFLSISISTKFFGFAVNQVLGRFYTHRKGNRLVRSALSAHQIFCVLHSNFMSKNTIEKAAKMCLLIAKHKKNYTYYYYIIQPNIFHLSVGNG